jgi:serine/threonine protein kinase
MSAQGHPDAPPLGTIIAERYRLDRFLGAGGMGAVYEAVDGAGRRVAVKVLLESVRGASQEAIERFRREAAVTQGLQTPHIVPALDAGFDPMRGYPFMVMPLMVGMDLDTLIERTGPLHPTVAARIIRQACVALDIAHRAGVVHRDIKPANVFLDHAPDGKVTVRVLDFGLAKAAEGGGSLTATGSVMGTPVFMAPEQVMDAKRVDARTDVWAIGMSLFQALTARIPFLDDHATSIAQALIAVAHTDVPWVQDLAPWVDPSLARLVHGTLLRELDVRCPSARELYDALAPFAFGSDEVSAAMFEPLREEVRRHRAPRAERPVNWHAAKPVTAAAQALVLTMSETDPLLGRQLAGRYTLLRTLGRGGMGAVYEASAADGRRLAVKVIHPEHAGGASAVHRFVREARVVQSIESPNVVRVFEVDSDPQVGLPFMAMELLHGLDLGEVIRRNGAIEPAVCARLFVQACRGLSAAHARGFAHRDVKPSNLFLHREPTGELHVKLCDFGIVKQLGGEGSDTAQLTRTGGVIGSPMYMSPEQAQSSKDVDQRTDVWSLGAALYEALSGTPPWAGRTTVGELILAVCTLPLDHLQDRAPWVPPMLADVVHRAMRRNPAERYQSMDEMMNALLPGIGGQAAVADRDLRPASAAERSVVAARLPVNDPAIRTSQGGGAAGMSGAVQAVGYGSTTGGYGARQTGSTTGPHLLSSDANMSAAYAAHPQPPKSGRTGLWIVLGVVVLGAAGFGAMRFGVGGKRDRHAARSAASVATVEGSTAPPAGSASTAPAASVAPSASSSAAPADKPARFAAKVAIKPAHATVLVEGKPTKLVDGGITLEGEVGDQFTVTVKNGTASRTEKVMLGKEGKPSLELIDVAAPATKALPIGKTTQKTKTGGVRPSESWK